ncbi:MAG: exodeoxyribonuclease VII large subunit [Saprospiraceae bacterium]|nr:exodeoxyribonuclease VII large subunit [Saprospiraceae bacterium]
MQSYSLYELNEYIRRVVALNFTEPVWINCEISQVKESRGNVYLDLIESDEKTQEVKAQISATIWYKSFLFLKNKLGALLPSLLAEGTHVMLKVTVEFHERYGLKLNIEDIDPAFTIGQLEMARQKILQKLSDEGVLGINKEKKLPLVIQKVAVISSSTAAGYIDFENHIQQNIYGYAIQYQLFSAAMQGQNTEREVCAALDLIQEQSDFFDCIIIIRGGGSKLDLGGFDNFNIGYKIATCSLPVVTGIGHEIDSTVADTVARLALKTPTAVADFIINHNLAFENKIIETAQWIAQTGRQIIRHQDVQLTQVGSIIQAIPKEIIKNSQLNLLNITKQLNLSTKVLIRQHNSKLEFAEQQITALDPVNVLKRGFAIVKSGKKYIQTASEAKIHPTLEISFSDGNITVKTK